jgi:hypothetical protein
MVRLTLMLRFIDLYIVLCVDSLFLDGYLALVGSLHVSGLLAKNGSLVTLEK